MERKVKTFFSRSLYSLEQEINEYIENHSIEINHIKALEIKAISEYFFYAYMLYCKE